MKENFDRQEVRNNELNIQDVSTQKKYWTCDACDGSSSTGCLSTTGECYR